MASLISFSVSSNLLYPKDFLFSGLLLSIDEKGKLTSPTTTTYLSNY
jgi:hypothetical protein